MDQVENFKENEPTFSMKLYELSDDDYETKRVADDWEV
jgi:hypothetical protein